MKNIITFCCLLLSVISIAQKQKATLYFKDGKELVGLAKITGFSEVKFRKNMDSKKTVYNYQTLDKIIISERGINIEYVYKKPVNKAKPTLFQPIIKGAITILRKNQKNYYGSIGSVLHIVRGDNYLAFELGYVNVTPFKYLNSNYMPDYNVKSSRLIKKIIKEVNDCPKIMDKINSKEFIKMGILDIVKYYNSNCTSD